MGEVSVHSLLARLSEQRPLFHNEADFQHAFAWLLHLEHPEARIRLEWRSPAEPRASIDLYAELDGMKLAVEFKYLTRALDIEVDGERFALRSQGAQDLGRYDTIKDVVRLERLAAAGAIDLGWTVLLSNNDAYWSPRRSPGTIDEAFGLHDGARLAGTLGWAAHAGGTTKGRETVHQLAGSYDCRWSPYSSLADRPGGAFRYLNLELSTAPAAPVANSVVPSAPPSESARRGRSDMTARQHVLAAFERLEGRHGRDSFAVEEVVQEALAGGATHAESTLRTHITSSMCVNAPANHQTRYPDLERLGAGRYRRVRHA